MLWKTRRLVFKGPLQCVLAQSPSSHSAYLVKTGFLHAGTALWSVCCQLQYVPRDVWNISVLQVSHSSIHQRRKIESLIWSYLTILTTQDTSKASTFNHGCFKTVDSSAFANSWGRKLIFPENTEADGSSVNARISLQILLTWNSFGQLRTSGVNMGEGNEKFLECT